ncbi:hypothetical protein HYW58_01655 [Candidatus Kaiserbacteria bacterium]|nr:hypothetical protein [Candidatus Kaiserbacteria bacterium]
MDERQTDYTPVTQNTRTPLFAAGGVVILIILAVALWWFVFREKPEVQPPSTGIGAQLFEDIDNPIEDKVPSVETTANPIENFYKNPFE